MSLFIFCPSLTKALLLLVDVKSLCDYSKEDIIMRIRVRRQCYYDARVNDVNLEEITSSVHNANILRALRDEQPDSRQEKEIALVPPTLQEFLFNDDDFVVREGDDLGWLAYFIGRSKCLDEVYLFIDAISEVLIEGITRNTTINTLYIGADLGDQAMERLSQFIRSNKNLLPSFGFSFIESERAHNKIASALSQMQHNSMKTFMFRNNIISDEGFSEICVALVTQPQLEILGLKRNDIGRNGCMALGNMLSSWHAPNLQHLNLEDNSIDDRGLQGLVAGMVNCSNLLLLKVSGNRSITAAGLRSLSMHFQSENCSLKELYLERMNIGDDGAAALADGLVGNKTLERLFFDVDVSSITEVGWSAFSKLLCDTSSINNTYLSNHSLEKIGQSDDRGAPEDVRRYLNWNQQLYLSLSLNDIGMYKILMKHSNMDIVPLFQWKMKLLPFVVGWFQIANYLPDETSYESKKLSAVYKFVHGMPMLVIDGYQSQTPPRRSKRRKLLNGGQKAR